METGSLSINGYHIHIPYFIKSPRIHVFLLVLVLFGFDNILICDCLSYLPITSWLLRDLSR